MNNSEIQYNIFNKKTILNDNERSLKDINSDLKIVKKIYSYSKKIKKNSNEKIKILDIGLGTGFILRKLDDNFLKIGVDISDDIFSELKNYNIKAFKVDLEKDKLEFNDGEFDMVISNEVIEHILSPDNYLNEINRVLKVGGVFIISFPNINSIYSFILQYFLDYPPHQAARYKGVHVRDYSFKLGKKILKNYNFDIIESFGVRSFLSIGINFFSQTAVIIAKKRERSKIDDRNVVWKTSDI